MEWKKENTDMEELNRKQKEYIDEALRMMKRAENLNTEVCVAKSEEHTCEIIEEESSENTYPETETDCSDKCEEETHEAVTDCCEEKETDCCDETEEAVETKETVEAEEVCENITEEKKETEPEEDYGVYTAEEILSGEGFINAEKIIDEIKQQKNAMKKIAEEQEAAEAPRTCPKCGKTIDGRT